MCNWGHVIIQLVHLMCLSYNAMMLLALCTCSFYRHSSQIEFAMHWLCCSVLLLILRPDQTSSMVRLVGGVGETRSLPQW